MKNYLQLLRRVVSIKLGKESFVKKVLPDNVDRTNFAYFYSNNKEQLHYIVEVMKYFNKHKIDDLLTFFKNCHAESIKDSKFNNIKTKTENKIKPLF